MAYMQIALGAISIGVILMIGYLVLGQVRSNYDGLTTTNANITNGLNNAQATILSGFGLVAVGIIVVAAFGLINVFM